MDQKKVQKIVEANIDRLKKKLHLELWDVTFEYGPLNINDLATCIPNIEYQHAVIKIDPGQMDDEKHVLHTMLHELLHLITCTFATYRLAIAHLIDAERAYDAANVMYDRANEEVVTAFTRILEDEG